jgi:hypothetical protein
MNGIVLQYLKLENLLAELPPAEDALRVHVLEQTQTTTSQMLTWREITIGLCVRAITANGRILSWYGRVAQVAFYVQGQPGNGERSPEHEAYQAAWAQARSLQAALAVCLREQGHAVFTDGLIELALGHFVQGVTGLIDWPEGIVREQGGA